MGGTNGGALYYYRARYYDPVLGRFVAEDPVGILGGDNSYAYVNGNSISYRDLEGKWVTVGIGATIGGIAGAIQAANQNGGWSWNNAGAITAGALSGAGAGALAGAVPASWGLLGGMAAGAFAGLSGNAINQLAGDKEFSWCQAGTQALVGAISGAAGWGIGISSALKYVASNVPVSALARSAVVQNALNQGAIGGSVGAGTTQVILNLGVPTSMGGFYPNECGCKF